MKKLKLFGKILVVCIGLFVLFNVGFYVYCYITPKLSISKSQSYYLYDNKGELIIDDKDDWVELDDISDYLVDATISVEDKYFYKHLGFDYLRILKAMINNIKSGSLNQGASTITQQYARNLFLNYEKTWSRKIDEAILAGEIETHYSKDEILEGYLNTINYGGIYGIENASWYYFGKSSSDLDLAEASMLAGIPQSPSNYSPLSNIDLAKKRQRIVLTSMVNNDIITQEESDEAYMKELSYLGEIKQENLQNVLYFRDAVINELYDIPTIPDSLIETGELKIYTTLDVEAQEALEKASDTYQDDNSNLQVAGVMMNPNDGGVMALIGGYDYSVSQYNRAVSAKRQVGSIMKPILYYYALENGFTSSSCFTSEKTTFNFSSNQTYTPNNYNDNYANGPITMGAAISYSDNIYAVKTDIFLGEEGLVNMANRLGIQSKLDAVPSLALGTGEISMLEMVSAYSMFANMGYEVEEHFITKVTDKDDNVLYEYKYNQYNVLNSNLTFILNEMLTYTYDKDFIDYNYPTVIGLLPKITNKYAIKTGTTDTDRWIMGYNKNAVLAIWSGYDDNSKLTDEGSSIHKDIWIDTMEEYSKDKDNSWYDIPENVVGVLVNPITGELVKEDTEKKKIFYYIKGTEPGFTASYNFEEVFKEENEVVTELETSNNEESSEEQKLNNKLFNTITSR